jgi:hypothetical protein
MRLRFALALLVLSWPVLLHAQWPAQVVPGARVQLRLPELQYQEFGLGLGGLLGALFPQERWAVVPPLSR